ncbi:hypothetical protein G7Y79_00052g087510 [Physcia stellaris]|nr:hypothetical protein G7Y79_00052g087510 [Physcia stellaris]
MSAITAFFKSEERLLPSKVHIEPVTSSTIASYRRLITLLLPIRYPDKFYKDSVANNTDSSLARIAIWNGGDARVEHQTTSQNVVGGIQCRLEDVPSTPTGERLLYIQTVGVLAPYRQLGIATLLLDDIVATVINHYEKVTLIYAHVWEANTDALEWYSQRGFALDKEVLQGYYRRLKPSGARIVRRRISIEDHLAAKNHGLTSGAEEIVPGDGGSNQPSNTQP